MLDLTSVGSAKAPVHAKSLSENVYRRASRKFERSKTQSVETFDRLLNLISLTKTERAVEFAIARSTHWHAKFSQMAEHERERKSFWKSTLIRNHFVALFCILDNLTDWPQPARASRVASVFENSSTMIALDCARSRQLLREFLFN
jgi:hypothetical protein